MKSPAANDSRWDIWRLSRQPQSFQYLTALGVVAVATGAAFLFTPVVGAHATALVYLLVVVLVALMMDRGPALAAALVSALCWDFFFLPPTFTLAIHSFEDAMLFVMYFVVALALGQLTSRIKAHQAAEQEARLLLESERLSKTLLDSMSHELRTPIAAIQGAIGNMLELPDAGLSPLQRKMVDEISEATERLHRLVGNALEISRLESGAVTPKITDCDPAEVVHLSVAATGKRLARHDVRVHIEQDAPMAPMDFLLTQEALVNLLSNAAAHTPPGTAVEISARTEGQNLVLTVVDNGPGIDPHLLPRLFDKFFRAPNAPAGGTGLGLSLVKGFVEAQGGTVSVASQPGRGTAFTIRLPLGQRTPDAPAPCAEPVYEHQA